MDPAPLEPAARLARLEAEGSRREEQLRATTEVCRRLALTASLDELLPLIAREAARLVHLDTALVRLAEGEELVKVAVTGAVEDATFAERLRLGEGLSGQAALQRQPVVSHDLATDPHFRGDHRQLAVAHGLRSAVSLPMIVQDELVGTLSVFGERAEALADDEMALLRAFADQAAVAIQRARLLEQLEQRNRELERASHLKSQFLANMSHELRTPMNSIIGYTQLILDGLDGPLVPAQQRDLEKVLRSAEDLLRLINDILDLSKIEAGRLDLLVEPFDLAELVRSALDTVQPMARAKGLELRCDVEADLPRARGDSARVQQIVLNLLSNAIKFTDIGHVAVRLRSEDGMVLLAVTDSGIGIPPDAQQYVFDEFRQVDGSTTRRHGGTGLGLAIARKLVELLGGRLWLKSQLGRGSTFSLALPLGDQPATPKDAPEPPPAASQNVVLAVDDDPDVIDLIGRQLRPEGYAVFGLCDGREAVRRARELRPAAITLDISMPGYDGWQILHDLRSDPATAQIPILVLSMIENRELGFSLGATEYLLKPVRKEELVGALRRLGAALEQALVLMVDDDPAALRVLERGVAAAGYRVATAESGRDALRLALEHPPGCVVLDLMMPGLDGFQVLAELRAKPATRDVPVVVVTAKYLDAADRARLNGNVVRVFQKACYPREELLRELAKIVARIRPVGQVGRRA